MKYSLSMHDAILWNLDISNRDSNRLTFDFAIASILIAAFQVALPNIGFGKMRGLGVILPHLLVGKKFARFCLI